MFRLGGNMEWNIVLGVQALVDGGVGDNYLPDGRIGLFELRPCRRYRCASSPMRMPAGSFRCRGNEPDNLRNG